MVTNPIQSIKLFYGELLIRMKDKEVRLNNVIDIANKLRIARGLQPVLTANYIRSSNFLEMVHATEIKLGYRENGDYSGVLPNRHTDGTISNYKTIKSPLVRVGYGRAGGTWCHPYIAIDTAAYLDKSLAVDLYEILTTSPIFQLREDGGDLYKELTDAVITLVGESGRAITKVQLLAKVVAARAKLAIRADNSTWNHANAEQLQIRHKIQEMLIFLINNGVIRTFSGIIELAASGKFIFMPDLPVVDLDELVKEKVAEAIAVESSET